MAVSWHILYKSQYSVENYCWGFTESPDLALQSSYVNQISNYVWYYIFQIQETARSIIQNIEGDLDSDSTLPMPSPGGNTSVDKAADKWSMAFCEFYRDD